MLINKDTKQFGRDEDKQIHEITQISALSKKELDLIQESIPVKVNSTKHPQYSPIVRQSIAVVGPLMMVISAGLVTGYSATLLPQLLRNDSTISITEHEGSWIAAIGALPMSIGCFIGGYLMEKLGRRMVHIVMCVPSVFGWTIMACSTNIYVLLFGRFLTGLVTGILGSPTSVYIGEVTEPKYRGVFLGGISLSISIGIFITHLIGTFYSWKLNAALSALFPLLCYLIMSFVPESPSWLLSKGNLEESEHAFRWLRGSGIEAMDEFQAMVERHNANVEIKKNTKIPSMLESWKISFKKPGFLQPLVVMLVFFSTLQLSGVNAVIFYTVTILKDTLQKGFNEYVAMLLIDIIRLAMSVLACVLMKKFDRRPLSLAGTGGSAASLLGLAGFLYILSKTSNTQSLFWIPLVFLIGFIISTSIGLVPLPWCLIGEIFPLAERGLGSGISSAWNFVLYFVVVKTGPSMFVNIGSIGTFFLYGICALLGTIFLYFKLPETKNKTLQEIEDEFLRKNKLNQENKINSHIQIKKKYNNNNNSNV